MKEEEKREAQNALYEFARQETVYYFGEEMAMRVWGPSLKEWEPQGKPQ